MEPKLQILKTCEHCEGKAYLPDREVTNTTGERYMRHKPCPKCRGSGHVCLLGCDQSPPGAVGTTEKYSGLSGQYS